MSVSITTFFLLDTNYLSSCLWVKYVLFCNNILLQTVHGKLFNNTIHFRTRCIYYETWYEYWLSKVQPLHLWNIGPVIDADFMLHCILCVLLEWQILHNMEKITEFSTKRKMQKMQKTAFLRLKNKNVTQRELMRLFEGDIKTDILNSIYYSISKKHFDTKMTFISYSYQKL